MELSNIERRKLLRFPVYFLVFFFGLLKKQRLVLATLRESEKKQFVQYVWYAAMKYEICLVGNHGIKLRIFIHIGLSRKGHLKFEMLQVTKTKSDYSIARKFCYLFSHIKAITNKYYPLSLNLYIVKT